MQKRYNTSNPKKKGFYLSAIIGLLLLIFVYLMSEPADLFYAFVTMFSFTLILFIIFKSIYSGYILDAFITINKNTIEIINHNRKTIPFENIIKIIIFGNEYHEMPPFVNWKIYIITNKEKIKFVLSDISAKDFIQDIINKNKSLKHKNLTSLFYDTKQVYYFR